MTAINGVAVLLGVFFLNGYIARKYGLEVLGEFLLVRRTTFAIMGIVLVGMNVGLPSLIGRYKEKYIEWSAFGIYSVITIPLILLITYLISMGNIAGFKVENALAYGLFLSGVSLQYLTYGMYRGHMKMVVANLIQITGTAVIPIIIFIFIGELGKSLSIIGLSLIILNMTAIIFHGLITKFRKMTLESMRLLLRFGMVRIVSFISQFVLLAGAPLLISFYNPYTDLAFFNSLISIVRLLLFAVGPLGIVLLPRIAKAVKENNKAQIAYGLEGLLKIIILFGSLVALFFSSTGGILLEWWLGSTTESASWMASVILLAIPFYLIVEIMRSPIDGLSLKGYNSIIYFTAALMLVISFFLLIELGCHELSAGVYSFLIGYVVAALGNIMVIKRLIKLSFLENRYLVLTISTFVSLIVMNAIVDNFQMSEFTKFATKLGIFILLSGLAFMKSRDNLKRLVQLSKKL